MYKKIFFVLIIFTCLPTKAASSGVREEGKIILIKSEKISYKITNHNLEICILRTFTKEIEENIVVTKEWQKAFKSTKIKGIILCLTDKELKSNESLIDILPRFIINEETW